MAVLQLLFYVLLAGLCGNWGRLSSLALAERRKTIWVCPGRGWDADSVRHDSYLSACQFRKSLCRLWWCFYRTVHLMGRGIDKVAPDRLDLIGGLIALIGVFVILYWPR